MDEMYIIREEKPAYTTGEDMWRKYLKNPHAFVIMLDVEDNGLSLYDQYGRVMDADFTMHVVEGLLAYQRAQLSAKGESNG